MDNKDQRLRIEIRNSTRALAVFFVYGAIWTVLGGAIAGGGLYYNLTAFRVFGEADEGNAAIFLGIAIAFVGNIGTIIAALREMNRSQ